MGQIHKRIYRAKVQIKGERIHLRLSSVWELCLTIYTPRHPWVSMFLCQKSYVDSWSCAQPGQPLQLWLSISAPHHLIKPPGIPHTEPACGTDLRSDVTQWLKGGQQKAQNLQPLSLKKTVGCRREYHYRIAWRPLLESEKWAQCHLQLKGTGGYIFAPGQDALNSADLMLRGPLHPSMWRPAMVFHRLLTRYAWCQESLALWSHHKRDFQPAGIWRSCF